MTQVRTTQEVRAILDAAIKEYHGLSAVREEAAARPLKRAIHGISVTELELHASSLSERVSAVHSSTDRKLEMVLGLGFPLSSIADMERASTQPLDPRIYIDQMKTRVRSKIYPKQLELGFLQNDPSHSAKRLEEVASELRAAFSLLENLKRLEKLYDGESLSAVLLDP